MFLGKKDESLKDLEKEIKCHVDEKYEKVPSFESVMQKCKTSNKSEVLNKELILSNGETVEVSGKTKFIKICIPVLIIALLASVLIGVLMNRNENSVIDPIDKKGGYFIIDVNPSLELSYDKDGNVKEATPLNEDAEIVLYNFDLIGKNYKEAIDLLVGKLVDLGYVEKENVNAILTTAVGEDGVKDEMMSEEVKNAFVSSLTVRQIQGEVLTGVVDEQLKAEAEEYGIDAQKLDLIKKLGEMGVEIPKEEYSKVTIRELYHKTSQREKEIAEEQKNKLQEENEKKKDEVDKSVKNIIDFLITIVGEDSEYKEQLDEINAKVESGENTADEVLTMLDSMELGGFELFLDMILLFKTDLQKTSDDLNKSQEEFDRSNMTLEEKYNERLENAKNSEKQDANQPDKNKENNTKDIDKNTEKNVDKNVEKNSFESDDFFDAFYGDLNKESDEGSEKESEKTNGPQKDEQPKENNEFHEETGEDSFRFFD